MLYYHMLIIIFIQVFFFPDFILHITVNAFRQPILKSWLSELCTSKNDLIYNNLCFQLNYPPNYFVQNK